MLGRRMLSFRPCVGQVRNLKSLLKRSSKFGNSIILLQEGHYVQELPVLVRHTSDHTFIMQNFGLSGDEVSKTQWKGDGHAEPSHAESNISNFQKHETPMSDDEKEFIDALGRVDRTKHIYSLLETATIEGVTPFVALQALMKVAYLESREEQPEQDRNFARQAVIQKLMQTILEGDDNETLVNTFMFMKDLQPQGSLSDLCDELRKGCIDKAAAGKLTISQTVRMVRGLRLPDGPQSRQADLLWQGIKAAAADIDETNVAEVCAALPLLSTSSRRAVFRTVLQRLPQFWWKLPPPAACQLMEGVHRARQGSPELCHMLSRWTSLVLHQLSETQLRVTLAFFQAAHHCDDTLQRATERYCRARGPSLSPHTAAALAAFALQFNIRSAPLLDAVCDHFVSQASRYGAEISDPAAREFHLLRQTRGPASDVAAVVRAVGELHYPPRNPLPFFAAVEAQLRSRFDQLPPEDILDMCLACVYLKRYPLNVSHQVFNLFFLERLSGADGMVARLRTKLALLDSALTLECPGHRGPMLRRDVSARSVHRDRRAETLAQKLLPLLSCVDGVSQVVRGEPLPQLHLYAPYIPQLRCRRADGRLLCLFLNTPELYARDGQQLLGVAQLRSRLLAKLRLLAVDLPLAELSRLVVHPSQLRRRLTRAVADAN